MSSQPSSWRATILTLFPEMFPGPLGVSLAGKALASGLWELEARDIRAIATDKHRSVDDTPAGGGPGMLPETKAPTLAEMEAMAHEIFERLPKTFRKLCEGVIIRVDDFPTDEVLDEMQAGSEFDLLGLFQGIGLPHQSHGGSLRLS